MRAHFPEQRLVIEPIQMPNFSKAEPNSNKGQPKLFQQAELIQTPILVLAELNSNGGKCSFQLKCLENAL